MVLAEIGAFTFQPRLRQVVVIDGDGQILLGALLAVYVLVEVGDDLFGGWECHTTLASSAFRISTMLLTSMSPSCSDTVRYSPVLVLSVKNWS